LTAVDILNTAPCGNTIIVTVCSSNGSVCGAAPREASMTRDPCTLTVTSRETASEREPDVGLLCALACGFIELAVGLATSTESFVSGAIVLSGSYAVPRNVDKDNFPLYMALIYLDFRRG